MRAVRNAAESQVGERFIEGVIRDAHFMADLTAAFLNAHGFHPSEPSPPEPLLPADDPLVRQAQTVLLNLAAAIRIARWEQAGLKELLPAELPSATEAFRSVLPAEVGDENGTGPTVTSALSRKVFRVSLERFSNAGLRTIGTDMLLPTHAVSEDELLDALADLLWENRYLRTSGDITDEG